MQMFNWTRNKNEEIIPVSRLSQTVWTYPPGPATSIRTCTVKQRTFFAPTLGIGVWSWICLHYRRSIRLFSLLLLLLCVICPTQVQFLLFIWFSIGFCWAIFHSSSFVILSVHFIFIIRLNFYLQISVIFWLFMVGRVITVNNTTRSF